MTWNLTWTWPTTSQHVSFKVLNWPKSLLLTLDKTWARFNFLSAFVSMKQTHEVFVRNQSFISLDTFHCSTADQTNLLSSSLHGQLHTQSNVHWLQPDTQPELTWTHCPDWHIVITAPIDSGLNLSRVNLCLSVITHIPAVIDSKEQPRIYRGMET